jgi:hypothetical protein
MTKAWNQWVKPFETAMNGLSIALTSEDKNILRRSIGIPSHG